MSDVIDGEDNDEIPEFRSEAGKIFSPGDGCRFGETAEDLSPSAHAQEMCRRYHWQAGIFDVTRAPVLFGRGRLGKHVKRGDAILEVGCGTGQNLAALRRAAGVNGRVIGLECTSSMLHRARRRNLPDVESIEAEYGVDPLPADVTPLDAIIFSYSLSMIPDFAGVVMQTHRDLRVGGRLIVLDFVDSPSRLMAAWMRSLGVTLGPSRDRCIATHFAVVHREVHRAWLGLWRYQLLVAERTAS